MGRTAFQLISSSNPWTHLNLSEDLATSLNANLILLDTKMTSRDSALPGDERRRRPR